MITGISPLKKLELINDFSSRETTQKEIDAFIQGLEVGIREGNKEAVNQYVSDDLELHNWQRKI